MATEQVQLQPSALFRLRNAIHILVLENVGVLDDVEQEIVDSYNNLVGDAALPIKIEDYQLSDSGDEEHVGSV